MSTPSSFSTELGKFIILGSESPDSDSGPVSTSTSGLSGGVIAVIVLGALGFLASLAALIYFLSRWRPFKDFVGSWGSAKVDQQQEMREFKAENRRSDNPPPPFREDALLEVHIPLHHLHVPIRPISDGGVGNPRN